ncbi:MAG TPA: transcriptional repressor [Candidatus Ornithomonoglobus merdipullorum]|uniref:Transcriptional repressor n=1 Tax=Candidatus Ornithomonoglobus merdipullorum TaxID=2840895 RepID=A0A9D1SEH3_9FIRM|nr:transcriptional repressor [Candidatus Ornithomonoglobus merdipullorum]
MPEEEDMNYSKQREAMMNILRNTRSHPTAQEIYAEMRKTDPKISLGTIYRNLALLTKTGSVMRIDTIHESVHYDAHTDPHYHFICSECKRVYDLDMEPLELDAAVEENFDCTVTGHSLIFYGVCGSCKNK